MGAILHYFGIDTTTGPLYAFYSGFGGILERLLELFAIGGLLLWRTSCYGNRRCLRHGRHEITDPETGVKHKVCWKHAGLPSKYSMARIREIQAKHKLLYLGDKPGRG